MSKKPRLRAWVGVCPPQGLKSVIMLGDRWAQHNDAAPSPTGWAPEGHGWAPEEHGWSGAADALTADDEQSAVADFNLHVMACH